MQFFKRLSTSLSIFWQMVRVGWQACYGVWYITVLPQPIVSIFGGSRMTLEDPYAKKAELLARRLIDQNISIITGGGSGIMEATTRGAVTQVTGKGKTVGINLRGVAEANHFLKTYFSLDYLYARKILLTHYSKAFVVFPGGFGTLDELAEVLTLMETKKIKRFPLILIGTEFWNPFIEWLRNEAVKRNLISQENLELVVVLDDLDEVFKLLCVHCA